MNYKSIISSLVLLFFSLLAGGSVSEEDLKYISVPIVGIIIFEAVRSNVKGRNKKKRLQMIEQDEQDSSDFDRSISIGNDRCKIYFDTAKKKVMIMQITTKGVTKNYIDDFDFPGWDLVRFYDDGCCYLVYEPTSRRLLTGINDCYRITEIENLEGVNKGSMTTKDPIAPSLNLLKTTYHSDITIDSRNINVLVDEHHGLMAVVEQGKIYAFNYINVEKLPEKVGIETTISVKKAGNYMFVTDFFFKVLVIISGNMMHKTFNYSDIIEVSYIENGDTMFTKSTGRTIGGALVGGVLMGGAGAVVGGLSGDTKQDKVVRSMDIKILLRSTKDTTCILHFMDSSNPLKTKEASDKTRYEAFLKNANDAKDLLSVIIDDAKQTVTPISPVISQPVAQQSPSVADELAKLAKLKADGILTDEEFQTQKAKLLE